MYIETKTIGKKYVKFHNFIEINRIRFNRNISKDDMIYIRMKIGEEQKELVFPINKFVSPLNQLADIIDANLIILCDELEIKLSTKDDAEADVVCIKLEK